MILSKKHNYGDNHWITLLKYYVRRMNSATCTPTQNFNMKGFLKCYSVLSISKPFYLSDVKSEFLYDTTQSIYM